MEFQCKPQQTGQGEFYSYGCRLSARNDQDQKKKKKKEKKRTNQGIALLNTKTDAF